MELVLVSDAVDFVVVADYGIVDVVVGERDLDHIDKNCFSHPAKDAESYNGRTFKE